jgi:Domain of unknown function (DUF4388)
MSASKTIPFEGVLNCWNDEHDLPDLILAVSRAGKTGRLLFSNAEADKTLYVKDGKIVFAESSSDDDGLGQYLLRIGKISLQDFTRVSRLVEPGKRLGALLVAEGVLGPKELVPAVVGQVRSIILGLFRRTETWYGFKEEELSRKESITLDMPVAELLLDGVQYVDSWRRISKGVGDLESVYRLGERSEEEWSALALDDDVLELLSTLKEPVSVAGICAESRMEDFNVCRYLWVFRALGWVEAAEVGDAPAELDASEVDALAAAAEEAAPPELPVFAAPPREPELQPEPELAAARPDLSSTVLDVSLPPSPPPASATKPTTTTTAAPKRAASPTPAPAAAPAGSSAIPQHLVQTRIAAQEAKTPAPPKPPQQQSQKPQKSQPPQKIAPRPVPEALARTQLAIDSNDPAPPRPPGLSESQVRTIPSVKPPKSIPDELLHTQMYVTPPSPAIEEEPAGPSTGEMMEAILDDGEERYPDFDASPDAVSHRVEQTPAPSPSSASTQYFPSASALEPPPAPVDAATASYDDLFPSDLSSSFASLSLDYGTEPTSVAPPTVPSVARPELKGNETRVDFDPPSFQDVPQTFDPPPDSPSGDSGASSFQDLDLSDSGVAFAAEAPPVPERSVPAVPLAKASVADAVGNGEPMPVVEGDLVAPEPAQTGGMEIFAMTDPFGSSGASEPPPALVTDDPLRPLEPLQPLHPNEPTVAESLPRRRRSQEIDPEADGLGNFFRGDETR